MPDFGADDALDPELMFRDARAQFDQVAELQRRLAELKGRAESSDGRVKAVYDQDRGLADLQLDPRALRMNAAELQETILTVSYEAKRDLERQVKEVTEESFAQQDFSPADLKDLVEDPQGITQTLGDMGKIFQGATKEVEGMLDQVRRAMQGMAGGPAPAGPQSGASQGGGAHSGGAHSGGAYPGGAYSGGRPASTPNPNPSPAPPPPPGPPPPPSWAPGGQAPSGPPSAPGWTPGGHVQGGPPAPSWSPGGQAPSGPPAPSWSPGGHVEGGAASAPEWTPGGHVQGAPPAPGWSPGGHIEGGGPGPRATPDDRDDEDPYEGPRYR
ncbi:YbaB/EbfC family nucleoid-associated protein [Actinomadura monticuli]|uniref:YbaB/EbfC family nucleoid-associated protein n=1 Tax=Actinomadura monticuli TaxID=3097367 RepID=A0ABV4Q5D6_9ACTN